MHKRTECEPSQLVAAEGIAVANAANKQCSTASLSVILFSELLLSRALSFGTHSHWTLDNLVHDYLINTNQKETENILVPYNNNNNNNNNNELL